MTRSRADGWRLVGPAPALVGGGQKSLWTWDRPATRTRVFPCSRGCLTAAEAGCIYPDCVHATPDRAANPRQIIAEALYEEGESKNASDAIAKIALDALRRAGFQVWGPPGSARYEDGT